MACWEKHKIACEILLGKPYEKIHKIMDTLGEGEKNHRKYGHDMNWILAIISEIKSSQHLSPEDTLGYLKTGIIHLVQDYGADCVEEIEKFFTKVLQGKLNLKNLLQLPDNWFDSIRDLLAELFGFVHFHTGGTLKVIIKDLLGREYEYENVDKVVVYDRDGNEVGYAYDGRFLKIRVIDSNLTLNILYETSKFLDINDQKRLIEKYKRYKGLKRFLPLIEACNSCKKKDNCFWRN